GIDPVHRPVGVSFLQNGLDHNRGKTVIGLDKPSDGAVHGRDDLPFDPVGNFFFTLWIFIDILGFDIIGGDVRRPFVLYPESARRLPYSKSLTDKSTFGNKFALFPTSKIELVAKIVDDLWIGFKLG